MIFGSGDELYMEFACLAFRIYLMLMISTGIQIPSGIFFQAIGKSGKSALISLSRQILFLIPSMLILGKILGIKGILYAGPVADTIAFILSIILLIHEVKLLNKNTTEIHIKQEEKTNTNTNQLIITISREYGSGGRYIGKLVSEKLGIKLYDKEIISKLSSITGLSEEYIEKNEQKANILDNLNNGYYYNLNNNDELFIKESELIKKLATESCVIIGRCADFILKDEKNITKIFIYNSEKQKINRAVKYYHLNKSNAAKEINKINKLRSNHYKHYTGNIWNNPNNYDICINSDTLGVEETAELICKIIKNKYTL